MKILMQETDKLFIGAQGGEDINETKQLHLELVIACSPIQEKTGPPAMVPHVGGMKMRLFGKRLLDLANRWV
jgi:hypothetical protein